MRELSAEERGARQFYFEALQNFYSNAKPKYVECLEELRRADKSRNESMVRDQWHAILETQSHDEVSAKVIVQYLDQLADLHERFKTVLPHRFPSFVSQEIDLDIDARIYRLLLSRTIVREPIVFTGKLAFVFLRESNFQDQVVVRKLTLAGGMVVRRGSFTRKLEVESSSFLDRGLDLQGAEFVPGITIRDCKINGIRMPQGPNALTGDVSISENTVVQSDADFSKVRYPGKFELNDVEFRGRSFFQRAKFDQRTVLNATFASCPEFFDAELSKETRLDEMRLDGRAVGRGRVDRTRKLGAADLKQELLAVRYLRIEAQKNRWTREEVAFFAEEQRLERHLIPFLANPIERSISAGYDLVSIYGSSVSRALMSFFAWNAAFGIVFWLLLNLFQFWLPTLVADYWWGLPPSSIRIEEAYRTTLYLSQASMLAMQNALNPLALFSGKALVTVNAAWALCLSVVQSVGSLGLLALLLLALRSRFQRSSSGGGTG